MQALSQNLPGSWEDVDAVAERSRTGERGQAELTQNGPSYRHCHRTFSVSPQDRLVPVFSPCSQSHCILLLILGGRCRGCPCYRELFQVLPISIAPLPSPDSRLSSSSGVFGRRLNVWNLSCRTLTQCFDLGEDSLPLSVKFLHNPNAAEGYVSCALSGIIYRFYKACCEASILRAATRNPGVAW